MARVSNFTCNNETRGATHRIKGPGDEGGKAETYRRIDAVGVDGRNERAMIGRKIGRGTRSVNDREKDEGKMIYMWRRERAVSTIPTPTIPDHETAEHRSNHRHYV